MLAVFGRLVRPDVEPDVPTAVSELLGVDALGAGAGVVCGAVAALGCSVGRGSGAGVAGAGVDCGCADCASVVGDAGAGVGVVDCAAGVLCAGCVLCAADCVGSALGSTRDVLLLAMASALVSSVSIERTEVCAALAIS